MLHVWQLLQICFLCRSDFALCYNDRSVLENHHLQYAFQLLKKVSETESSHLQNNMLFYIYSVIYCSCMTLEQNSRVCTNKHMHILQEELNILQGLSPVEFAEVRALVIDMVLATDMSAHFEHVKQMRLLLSAPDSASLLSDEHRSKVLCLLLHTADISHPGKPWETHTQWTDRITDEFFRQGDWEKELALPLSPLCDRSTTPLTESQIGECVW
jgi:calcium/calmodulin-dependent 3',5'-cyclic nucleotide phosphodiesterase